MQPFPHTEATLALMWAGIVVPPAILLAHQQRAPAALTGAGAGVVLLQGILIAQRVADTGASATTALDLTMQAIGFGLIVAGLGWAVVTKATPAPVRRGTLPASTLMGLIVLAFSWWRGGTLSWLLPLWIIAPLILAWPALRAPKERPVMAGAALIILVIGALVPVATCTHPYVTDAPRADDPDVGKVERVSAWHVMGHGPWPREDAFLAAWSYSCAPRVPLLGVVWLGALLALPYLPLERVRLRRGGETSA